MTVAAGAQAQVTIKKSKEVGIPMESAKAFAEVRCLVHDLMGGTKTMREAKTKWLPKEMAESHEAYTNRLARSFLFNGLADAVNNLVSKPFAEPVKITEGEDKELSDFVSEIAEDVDLQGRNLTQFGREIFKQALLDGVTHVLVDYPSVEPGMTLEQVRQLNIRPFFTHVTADQLIGWRFEKIGGQETLSQIRILECVEVPDGDFGMKEVKQVRVIYKDTWQTWRKEKEESDEYSLVAEGKFTLGKISLLTLYFNRKEALLGKPPLEDLAWVNLDHWQSQSDQRNILHVARVPILFASGWEQVEDKAQVEIGASRLIKQSSPEAELKYVEHTGAAIEAGRQDLKDKEEKMTMLGMQPLIQKTGSTTATATALNASDAHSAVQAWTRETESFLEKCFKVAGEWDKQEIDVSIDIDSDYFAGLVTDSDITSLIAMAVQGLITEETFLNEVRRRGLLDESLDVQAELQKLKDKMTESAVNYPDVNALIDQAKKRMLGNTDPAKKPVPEPVK